MKKVDTWMPLLVDKYLGDTTDLTTEQHGAYLLLLMSMWKRDGTLPLDDARLAAITKLSAQKWRASKALLLEFFDVSNGTLTQKRLTEELRRANANNGQRSKAGKASAAKRAKERNGNGDANEAATDVASEEQQEAQQTGRPIPTPYSEAIASGAAAPPGSKDIVFALGVPFLTASGVKESNARSFLAMQCKLHTDTAVARAIELAMAGKAIEPISWLQEHLNGGRAPSGKRQSFRERDADVAAAEVAQWTGGLLDARRDRDNVIDMEDPRGPIRIAG